ncbi:MAG: hypothetical protein E7571_08270 [Ruminococcaceae bacterium]|nr:hypothetical protein [Oscillospiraceae bacterium]
MNAFKEALAKVGVTKNTIKRAGRTFIQAAVSYIGVNLIVIDFTTGKEALKSALIGLAVSSVAAGISAVMNLERNGEENE